MVSFEKHEFELIDDSNIGRNENQNKTSIKWDKTCYRLYHYNHQMPAN